MILIPEAEWRIYASIKQPPLRQIMFCRLIDNKTLSEPMQEYYQIGPKEQTSVKF